MSSLAGIVGVVEWVWLLEEEVSFLYDISITSIPFLILLRCGVTCFFFCLKLNNPLGASPSDKRRSSSTALPTMSGCDGTSPGDNELWVVAAVPLCSLTSFERVSSVSEGT